MEVVLHQILPDSIKRAAQADPNNQHCLIENCPNAQAVELAHVFSRESERHLVKGSEWHWGMRKGTLNLDTRQNIFFLGASLHQLYKDKKWALIPDREIVSKYFNRFGLPLRRNKFPNIEGDVFRYRFLPIDGLEDIVITRQDTNTTSEHVSIHEYPFADLPVVMSSVHPKFAILHLGRLLDTPLVSSKLILQNQPWLQSVVDLYIWWTSTVPEVAAAEPSYINREIIDSLSHPTDDVLCTPLRRIQPVNTPPESEADYCDNMIILSVSAPSSSDRSMSVPANTKRTADKDIDTRGRKKRLLKSGSLARHDEGSELDLATWTLHRTSRWVNHDYAPSTPPASLSSRRMYLRRSARIQTMDKRR